MTMQTYRVVTREPGMHPTIGAYLPTTTHFVKADTFVDACVAANSAVGPNEVIMEVSLSRPLIDPSDAELANALDQWFSNNGWEQADIDNVGSYISDSFESNVRDVASALEDSGLVPGLTISFIANSEGWADYSMVELFGYDGAYRAKGAEIDNLTNDHDAVGMASLISIARAIIDHANFAR